MLIVVCPNDALIIEGADRSKHPTEYQRFHLTNRCSSQDDIKRFHFYCLHEARPVHASTIHNSSAPTHSLPKPPIHTPIEALLLLLITITTFQPFFLAEAFVCLIGHEYLVLILDFKLSQLPGILLIGEDCNLSFL